MKPATGTNRRAPRILAAVIIALAAFATTACDVPTDPNDAGLDNDDLAGLEKALAAETDPDLVLAADQELAELTVETVEASLEEDPEQPTLPSAEARASLEDARDAFEDARRAYHSGDRDAARDHGVRARRALADALASGNAEERLRRWLARIEWVREALESDDDDYDRADRLADELDRLLDEARGAVEEGDLRAATRSLLEAQMRIDRARRARHHVRVDRASWARFSVARGHTAVELADRILYAGEPVDRQLILLRQATRWAEAAERAFRAHHPRRAVVLAQRAVHTALSAVLRPDVTNEEVRVVKAVAEELLEQAREAVDPEGDGLEARILRRAIHAFDAGCAALEEGNLRGIAAIWNAGVAAAVLVR